jgi:hypothetical protein
MLGMDGWSLAFQIKDRSPKDIFGQSKVNGGQKDRFENSPG